MAKKNREELEAFAQKMHDEGAAGFAAGLTPWETWDDFEDRVGSRVWQSTAEHVTEKARPTRSFGDRVLTAMTALAVATLAIGIAGVYFTHDDSLQLADSSTQLSPATPASTDSRPAESGGTFVALNEGSLPATPFSPDADNATKIDPAAAAPESQLTDLDSDNPLPVAPVADETLLATLKQKLATLKQKLAKLEQPPAAATDAMPAAPAAEQTARMDSDATLPLTTDDGDDMIAMLEELPATSAGAMTMAPATEQTSIMGSDVSLPLTTDDGDDMIAMPEELPATAAGAMTMAPATEQTSIMGSDVSLPVTTDDGYELIAMLEELPATAAGATPVAPAATQTAAMDSNIPLAEASIDAIKRDATPAIQPTVMTTALEMPGSDNPTGAAAIEMQQETTPAAASNTDPAQPMRLSQLTAPAGSDKPLQAAARDIGQSAQTSPRGDWSINLASYTRQSSAEKVRGQFLAKGVAAEQVVATVNGKTYYRLQVTGFASRKAALSQSAVIKEKLGLKEAWVTKQ